MSAPATAPMQIVELRATNTKRLKAVTIRPDADGNLVVLSGRNGQGKQQPVSEPVLTPDGWRRIGDLAPGDAVIGSDGKPTRVLAVFPQKERKTYLVTLDDGASTRCGPDHLWTVESWSWPRTGGRGRARKVETLSTAEILKRGLRRGSARRFSVPLPKPVEIGAHSVECLPIDPYILGLILGDGHIAQTGYTTVTKDDAEVLDAVAASAGKCWRGEGEVGTGAWSRPLRHLGLAGRLSPEKFIPPAYLMADTDSRRRLLSGLLDTDGTAASSWASYCTTSERLADEVAFLARSLGMVCKKGNAVTKKYRYKGELKQGLPCWNLLIRSEASPFTLPRKSKAWRPSMQRTTPRHFIDTIVEVEPEDSVCIQVDAKDGLYVTKDLILTHNTSVLDAIAMALGGREQIPAEPIRRGADHAEVVVDLGDLIVRRTFTAAGGGTLTVSNRDGARFQSPQTMLDALVGKLSFDPLAFSREEPKRQAETLRQLVGLDTAALDARRAALYQERTATNRQVDAMRARANAMPRHEDAPAAPVSVAELSERLQAANRRNEEVVAFARRRISAEAELAAQRKRVETLRAQLAEAETVLTMAVDRVRDIEAQSAEFVEVPTAPILQQLRDAEALNRKVRENEHRAAAEAAHDDLRSVSEGLTAQIKDIDAQRAAAIANAKMPVTGLGFDAAGGVTLNGLPLEQASGAERLRVSVAIGLAMNPRLRVLLIRDASLLDRDGMRMVAEMAAEAGAQLWLERVEVGAETTVVIEDGEVVEADPHEPARATASAVAP